MPYYFLIKAQCLLEKARLRIFSFVIFDVKFNFEQIIFLSHANLKKLGLAQSVDAFVCQAFEFVARVIFIDFNKTLLSWSDREATLLVEEFSRKINNLWLN